MENGSSGMCSANDILTGVGHRLIRALVTLLTDTGDMSDRTGSILQSRDKKLIEMNIDRINKPI
jgi:hypothetical protein